MYRLETSRQACKKLATLRASERERITHKINALLENPDREDLDIKKLINAPGYRLRIGTWRVIYDRYDAFKIIRIEKIATRGDAYK